MFVIKTTTITKQEPQVKQETDGCSSITGISLGSADNNANLMPLTAYRMVIKWWRVKMRSIEQPCALIYHLFLSLCSLSLPDYHQWNNRAQCAWQQWQSIAWQRVIFTTHHGETYHPERYTTQWLTGIVNWGIVGSRMERGWMDTTREEIRCRIPSTGRNITKLLYLLSSERTA